MDHPISADSTPAQTPTLTRRQPVADPAVGRFAALTAQEREVVDTFLAENRGWALRQARRAYRHLPDSLREQAVDRACTELRTRAPRSLERRVLAAELAERLTESLRHVHVGWCLNESSALLRREGTEPVQPEVRREDLAEFVDKGLGGLERAVLQLEIGAGRDTRTARAALRLGPRQYAAHREAGMSKLRDAISAQILGRACDQHVGSVVAAATGDRRSMEALTAGPGRCRFCAREAQGLRSVLHERLAVAPWPIAIAPAGALAAKLGALGTAFGAKSAGGTGLSALGGGSGASAAATVLAAAALATGTAALVDGDRSPDKLRKQAVPAAAAAKSGKGANGKGSSTAAAVKATKAERKAQSKSSAARKGQAQVQGTQAAPAGESPAAVAATGAAPAAAAPAVPEAPSTSGPVTSTTKPVTDTVDQTVDEVTNVIPGPVGDTVDDTVDGATNTVDEVTGVVDGLLPTP